MYDSLCNKNIQYLITTFLLALDHCFLFLSFKLVFHSLLSIVYSITPVPSFPNNEHIWGPCHFLPILFCTYLLLQSFPFHLIYEDLKVIINVPHTPQPNSCTPFDQEPTVSVKLIKRKWLITLHHICTRAYVRTYVRLTPIKDSKKHPSPPKISRAKRYI